MLPAWCRRLSWPLLSWSSGLPGGSRHIDIDPDPLPHPPDPWMSLFCTSNLVIEPPEMCSSPSHLTIPSIISSPWKKVLLQTEETFSFLKSSTLWLEVDSWAIDADYCTPPRLDFHCIPKGSGPRRALIQHLHCVNYKTPGDASSCFNILYLVILCRLKAPVWCVWPSERFLKAHLTGPKGRYINFYSDNGVDNDNGVSSYLLLEICSQGKSYVRISD